MPQESLPSLIEPYLAIFGLELLPLLSNKPFFFNEIPVEVINADVNGVIVGRAHS
jgi:hypothetical protein